MTQVTILNGGQLYNNVLCSFKLFLIYPECLLEKLHDSTSVVSNLARRQKDFPCNTNTTGVALVNNAQKLMRLSLLD